MGTDRYQVYDGTCPCGKGRVQVDECTPDHPYAKPHQIWWQAHCNCAVCNASFVLDAGRTGVAFYRKQDVAQQEAFSNQWHMKTEAFRDYAKRKGYYDRLARTIAGMKTKAAVHRAVGQFMISGAGTYQTFLKHFPGSTPEWVEQAFHGDSLLKALKMLLGVDDPALNKLHADAEDMWRKCQTPLQPAHTLRYRGQPAD